MNINSPYWKPPVEFDRRGYQTQKTNDLGFRNDIPYPMPATIGANYFGAGREQLDLPKELVYSSQGEYFARGGNVIPASGGKPLINIYSDIYKHRRSDFTRRV